LLFIAAQTAGQFLSGCPSGWMAHFPTRAALRRQYAMPADRSGEDCVTTWCCEPCALCQELNEQKLRAEHVPVGGAGVPTVAGAMPPPPPQQAMEMPTTELPVSKTA
jgi:hypothetical protein